MVTSTEIKHRKITHLFPSHLQELPLPDLDGSVIATLKLKKGMSF